jgi:hypothetical protein
MQPVVRVQQGQTHTINIPMADIDGDRLRCRWGVNASEVGGIYEPVGELQSNPCQLTYYASTLGYEGVAVVIEDFDSNNQVLSSIPLQFIIQIVAEVTTVTATTTTDVSYSGHTAATPDSTPPPPCNLPPEYNGNWRSGACIGIASNTSVAINITAKIPCPNSSTSIRDILTISPSGMTRGPIIQDPNDNDTYILQLEWDPRPDQYGIHQLCVTPEDNNTRSGQTTCFTLLVDVQSPQFIPNSASPTGVVLSNQSVWTIATDVDIVPPRDLNVSAIFYKRGALNGGGGDVEMTRVSASNADYQTRDITFNTGNTVWDQVGSFCFSNNNLHIHVILVLRVRTQSL